jgi:hypothetical protein
VTSNQPIDERLTSALSDRYRIEGEIGFANLNHPHILASCE